MGLLPTTGFSKHPELSPWRITNENWRGGGGGGGGGNEAINKDPQHLSQILAREETLNFDAISTLKPIKNNVMEYLLVNLCTAYKTHK